MLWAWVAETIRPAVLSTSVCFDSPPVMRPLKIVKLTRPVKTTLVRSDASWSLNF